MSRVLLDDLDASHLNSIVQDQWPESFTLDFKKTIDMSLEKDKREVAKDVSAFANSAGGRIIYGIDETTLANGAKVASTISPITQGDVDERIEDVIHGSIHPRPRFRTRKIPVSGGFAYVVEVYPSMGRDLHMVSAYGDMRFYRRSESHTMKMTEPEVREAYVRIASAHSDLQSQLTTTIEESIADVVGAMEVIVVAPVFGRVGLINPSQFGQAFEFGIKLYNEAMSEFCPYVSSPRLRLNSKGYQHMSYTDPNRIECDGYLGIGRTGVVVMAENIQQVNDEKLIQVPVVRTFFRLLCAIVASRHIYRLANYWGPVHLVHRSNYNFPAWLSDDFQRNDSMAFKYDRQCAPGIHVHPLPDFDLIGASPAELRNGMRELLDLIWQSFGRSKCPWFDSLGDLVERVRNSLGDTGRHLTP